MAKDHSFYICKQAGSGCPGCIHAKAHVPEEKACQERICSGLGSWAWCRPTRQRIRGPLHLPRLYRTVKRAHSNHINVKQAYLSAGLDLAELDPTLTDHEAIIELSRKLGYGNYTPEEL